MLLQPILNIENNQINPDPGSQANFSNLGEILTKLLKYALPLGGIILFFMIVASGFQMLTAGSDAKAMEKGKHQLTAAFVGFILLFVSFWLVKILEYVLGISIV